MFYLTYKDKRNKAIENSVLAFFFFKKKKKGVSVLVNLYKYMLSDIKIMF